MTDYCLRELNRECGTCETGSEVGFIIYPIEVQSLFSREEGSMERQIDLHLFRNFLYPILVWKFELLTEL